MIDVKDVVRLRIPYPDIGSDLACNAHMYICYEKKDKDKELVKCQTFKHYMLTKNPVKHFIREVPNVKRNPFKKTTLIDCDNLFGVTNVSICLSLRTSPITSVCEDLFKQLQEEVEIDGYIKNSLDTMSMKVLNNKIK